MKNYNHQDAYKHYVIKLNNDKRQKIDKLLNQLDQIHSSMIEQAVQSKEYEEFPEANEVINYIKGLK
jgi:predicted transcriptional regulator